MKRKKIILSVSAALIILLSVGLFLLFRPSPFQGTVKGFLDQLINHSDSQFMTYLAMDLRTDPFITLFREKEYIQGYRLTGEEKTAENERKIWVSLETSSGNFSVPFTVRQTESRCLIYSLPTVTEIPGAIALSQSTIEDGTTRILLDAAGIHLTCTRPAAGTRVPENQPLSILLLEDHILDFSLLRPIRLEKVLSIQTDKVEDIHAGFLSISPNLSVYYSDGKNITYRQKLYFPVGSENVMLYSTNDQIGRVAVITDESMPRQNLRVVLNRSGYSSLTHDDIRISCSQEFQVESPTNSLRYTFTKNDAASFIPSEDGVALYRNGNRLGASSTRWFVSSPDDEPLKVINLQRYYTSTSSSTPYRGVLEVAKYSGKLTLVNEVPLEEYLYSVVPSEMPVKFGLEALKVQAVAARSYAVRCLNAWGFAHLGAHVDDSTASQVYNNIAEQPIAIQAVEETHGLVPTYKDKVIDARFFSTSCGYTANFHEVWSDDENQFPSTEIPYLTAKPQYPGDAPSLYNEENFRAFVSGQDVQGYDRFSPFFRWVVEMTHEEMEASINHNLSSLQKTQPQFILTRTSSGSFVEAPVPEDIGELQNIEVLHRGEGGNIMELLLSTTHGTFKIIKELNIRRVLQPVNYLPNGKPIALHCYDKSIRENFSILPSTFAVIDLTRDTSGGIQSIVISGGGYGHGVGMSQYGTYGLSLLGYSFENIIEHFYPGTQLVNFYADDSVIP